MSDDSVYCDVCDEEVWGDAEETRECTCGAFLCSRKCELEHTFGYTVEQMKEMEKESIDP